MVSTFFWKVDFLPLLCGMTNIRRHFKKGNIYFLTHVTERRMPILADNFDLLWQAMQSMKTKFPFKLMACAVLPDHLHMLIDPGEQDLSELIRRIKLSFSANYRRRTGIRGGRVWQYRFWDHIIRDPDDMNRHIDYIHYNPVKHGLVTDPFEYPHSSMHEYYERGYYASDWGMKEVINIAGEFGE